MNVSTNCKINVVCNAVITKSIDVLELGGFVCTIALS